MNRRLFIYTTIATCCSCQSLPALLDASTQISEALGYSPAQLSNAVKEVLTLSITRASAELSLQGRQSLINSIDLPQELEQAIEIMNRFGLSSALDGTMNAINRGLELAAAEAKPVFMDALSAMSISNAIDIIRGGDSSATNYFRSKTEETLNARYRGIMQEKLSTLGFYKDYKQLLTLYKLLPVGNKPNLDLEEKAVTQGLNTLFTHIAVEENKIRANPAEQGNVLIAAVLGK